MKGLLIDLDGVIYDSQAGIPGAVQTMRWLDEHSVPYLYVTNTTSKPRQSIVERMADLEIQVEAQQILTPLVVAKQWLQQHAAEPIALFVPEPSRCEFADFQIIDAHQESGAGAVLVGDYGEHWDYHSINRAFRLLMSRPKPVLVALGMSRYWQSADGLTLDVGLYIKALEFASDCKTIVMGKPSVSFFNTAADILDFAANEIMMIGDDIVSDIQAAQQAGLKAAMVKTGKFMPQDLTTGIQPDWVMDSIADLPALLDSL